MNCGARTDQIYAVENEKLRLVFSTTDLSD